MEYSEKWEIVEELGSGGQGKVFRVIPKSIGSLMDRRLINALKRIGKLSDIYYDEDSEDNKTLKEGIINLIKREDISNHNALKVLHKPEDARDSTLADKRIRNEIEAMAQVNHFNLLKIIEYDLDSKWFVSKYYPKGSISKNRELYAGKLFAALNAFRPLVEGVVELHNNNMVHRDIKPENVFIDQDNNLILGDFGLIFLLDNDKTRFSDTIENVGSRDWMPPWAYGVRVEHIKKSFDVFCLGKLLWSLLSGKPKLLLWYYYKQGVNLEYLFPKNPLMKHINRVLGLCIVEDEGKCLPDANALLNEIDNLLFIVKQNVDLIDFGTERKCKECGKGIYQLKVDENITALHNFGIQPVGNRKWKIFTCTNCEHVQFFSYEGKIPEAWK
ncbi:MAG: protein kinase domain-containing protein [Candidatus Zhuqueibacterota bacterium]